MGYEASEIRFMHVSRAEAGKIFAEFFGFIQEALAADP
jgi:hypothetical protein